MTKKIEIELPEITKKQAELLEKWKGEYAIYAIHQSTIHKELNSVSKDILQAYLNGYTIKQEPKYYIHIIRNASHGYLNFQGIDNSYFLSTIKEYSGIKTQFTESEIKAIDPLLWEFRELVEE